MKVIEKFILGKAPDQTKCEDGIFVDENFVAVVDGATSKSNFSHEGKSSGRKAMEIILKAMESLPKDIKGGQAMLLLNEKIKSWYEETGFLQSMKISASERCTAAVTVYSRYCREIWQLGDCPAMIDGRVIGNEKYVDELFSNLRAFYLESELLEGKSPEELKKNDVGREMVLSFIKRQSKFQNVGSKNVFKYEIIDGFFSDIEAVKIIPVPDGTKEIVLASDGYPVLYSNLEESENKLREILQKDPLLFREFKSTKGLIPGNNSFDDRAFVRIDLKN